MLHSSSSILGGGCSTVGNLIKWKNKETIKGKYNKPWNKEIRDKRKEQYQRWFVFPTEERGKKKERTDKNLTWMPNDICHCSAPMWFIHEWHSVIIAGFNFKKMKEKKGKKTKKITYRRCSMTSVIVWPWHGSFAARCGISS